MTLIDKIIRNVNFEIEKRKFLRVYSKEYQKDEEISSIIEYVKKNGLKVFNYTWADDIWEKPIDLYYDDEVDLYYWRYFDKKIYIKRSHDSEIRRINCCRACLRDQAQQSPHSYDSFMEGENVDVIIDAGAAEGNFALKHIKKAKKIVIIETDTDWIEALKVTFKDYQEKVIIVNKYLSDYDDQNNVSLDGLVEQGVLRQGESFIIKMDIEGAEEKSLVGGKNYLSQKVHGKVIACAYHHQSAEEEISHILKEDGFETRTSKGYMYFPKRFERKLFNKKKFESRLRRALVVGEKN